MICLTIKSLRRELSDNTKPFQAVNQKSVSDAEKREKLIVIKKLEGLEKELKVWSFIVNTETLLILLPLQLLAYSESLTDQVRVWQYDVNWRSPLLQTLNQLRLENNRLREENLALLRVMDKIVKNWTFFFISSLCRGKDLTNTILYYNKSPFYLYRRLKTAVIARSLGPNFKVKYR